jgi:hypothetical protein
MGFAAKVASSWRISRFGISLEHSELGIAALNHKPVVRSVGKPAADFASEFLK